MPDIFETCSNHFAFQVRPSEQRELRVKAEAAGMSKAAFIRSRIPEVFDAAVPGRRYGFSPKRQASQSQR
jgi:hypothetical protein